MSDKPWIKIYNEVDSDCILGNQQGLTSLRDAIDYTLDNRIYSVEENFQADFKSIILVDKNWQQPKSEKLSFWQTGLLVIILSVWAVLLPIYALWSLF